MIFRNPRERGRGYEFSPGIRHARGGAIRGAGLSSYFPATFQLLLKIVVDGGGVSMRFFE
jgi:hypothetical protein